MVGRDMPCASLVTLPEPFSVSTNASPIDIWQTTLALAEGYHAMQKYLE